jgi:Domain of unknown function (DUF4159)
MRLRTLLGILALGLALWGGILLAQRPFKEYPAIEYSNFPLPSDANEKTEWTRARLRYPDVYGYPNPALRYADGREFPGFWTMDYPRSDRHFSTAIRRLTRMSARSVEEPIDLDDHDVYDWPWLYGVEVGHWDLTDGQAKTMREFLLRGGFFMCDDFHGDIEWSTFTASMHKVFPDRQIMDIPDDDPIFRTIYDLSQRYQVPGMPALEEGHTYEKGESGKVPHWRGIYDDHGRIIVAMCHNMDLGDSWEHADDPEYPAKYSDLGIRIGVNYLVYSMTH